MIEHRILTTENVPFTYRVAGLGSRFLAFGIDQTVIALFQFLCVVLAVVYGGLSGSEGLTMGVLLVLVGFAPLVYFLLWEWLWYGQTPGKRIMGIRVLTTQGTNISLLQAFVRSVLRFVDMLPFFLGAFGVYGLGAAVASTNANSRRLGDLAAGTLVVHVERKGAPLRALTQHGLGSAPEREILWRQRLGTLTKEQKQTVLDLCLRRDQLRLKDRARLFATIAQYLQSRLQLTPDEHQSDERFVQQAAVLLAGAAGSSAA